MRSNSEEIVLSLKMHSARQSPGQLKQSYLKLSELISLTFNDVWQTLYMNLDDLLARPLSPQWRLPTCCTTKHWANLIMYGSCLANKAHVCVAYPSFMRQLSHLVLIRRQSWWCLASTVWAFDIYIWRREQKTHLYLSSCKTQPKIVQTHSSRQ